MSEQIASRVCGTIESVIKDFDDGGIHSVGCAAALRAMSYHWKDHLAQGHHSPKILSEDIDEMKSRLEVMRAEIMRRTFEDAQGLYVALPTGRDEVSLYSVWALADAAAQYRRDLGWSFSDSRPEGLAKAVAEDGDLLVNVARKIDPLARENGQYASCIANLRLSYPDTLDGEEELLRYFGASAPKPVPEKMRG